MRKIQSDEKLARPNNPAEARKQISETFTFNKWSASEQARYLKELGFENTDWKQYLLEDVKKVLDDFEHHKMILYED